MDTKLLIPCFLLLVAPPSMAEVYKSVGANGKITYTNVAPATVVRKRAVDDAVGDGAKILTPDVIGAVANVMGVAQLVSSSREFCAATMPASHKRYVLAAQGWDKRNSAVVALKDRILAHPVQRMVADALSADMHRKTADLMHPVKQSNAAERVQWCDKAFADVDRGVLDLVGRPSIAPLMNYGRR